MQATKPSFFGNFEDQKVQRNNFMQPDDSFVRDSEFDITAENSTKVRSSLNSKKIDRNRDFYQNAEPRFSTALKDKFRDEEFMRENNTESRAYVNRENRASLAKSMMLT
jgi:hypothetical protein